MFSALSLQIFYFFLFSVSLFFVILFVFFKCTVNCLYQVIFLELKLSKYVVLLKLHPVRVGLHFQPPLVNI